MYDVQLTHSYFPAQEDFLILETTVGGVLRTRAARTPDARALIEARLTGETGRRWTYVELLADAERLARALLLRFEPGERICIWAPNVPEWVLLEYAAALAGLTLVTANPAYQERELRYVLEQSGSAGLFLVREHRGNPMWSIGHVAAVSVPGVRAVVDLEDHDALFARCDEDRALPDVSPGDPAQIQYTSGTTGLPKGVLLHHCGLTNNARLYSARVGVEEEAAALNFMPLFHTAGCGMMTLGAVQFGCRMILARLFDPSQLLDIVESERVAYMIAVPTMLIGLLEEQAKRPRDLSSVHIIVSGGAMVPPELVRRIREIFGCAFQTVYAQTESSPVMTQTCGDDSIEDLCETVGQPLPQTEVSIRDPNTGAVMAIGTAGEICARSYGVMSGYNDNPEATAAAIDNEGWLHTGDLGTMDARGYVRVTGRVKDMIIRGGENLFPAEIESVILEHPSVAEAAVVGAPDERWGEVVVAFVRLNGTAQLNTPALVAHCRERIAPHKTPCRWIAVDSWPLTGSGKIQKFVLRERMENGHYGSAAA